MINQSVNYSYTWVLFKIDSVPQNVAFTLDIAANFFNNLSINIKEFLISEGFQFPPRPPTEKNHKENQRLLLVRNAAVEEENNIRTIKEAVQPSSVSRYPETFM